MCHNVLQLPPFVVFLIKSLHYAEEWKRIACVSSSHNPASLQPLGETLYVGGRKYAPLSFCPGDILRLLKDKKLLSHNCCCVFGQEGPASVSQHFVVNDSSLRWHTCLDVAQWVKKADEERCITHMSKKLLQSRGLHVRLTPRELRTEESFSLYCRCLSSLLNLHVPVTAEKKRAKQDRQTRGRKKEKISVVKE